MSDVTPLCIEEKLICSYNRRFETVENVFLWFVLPLKVIDDVKFRYPLQWAFVA